MPVNNEKEPVGFPMKLRFGEKPKTRFKNNLDSIKVTLIDYPSLEKVMDYIPQFVEATWNDTPYDANKLSIKEKYKIIKDCFKGNALPTALETMRFTFLIEGISLQEVTHILRTRTASFSADCSADKWWSQKDALVPNSIINSTGDDNEGSIDDFLYRYMTIVKEAKQLYCDMIDSKEISIMDARYILPRCLETYYYMSMDAKNCLAFIHQRIDRMIQPETDNIIAYQMYYELIKNCSYFAGTVDIDETPQHYVKTATTRKCTRLYTPEENSDKFEYNEKDILYNKKRSEMNGTNKYAANKFSNLYGEYKRIIKAKEKCIEIWEKDNGLL